MTKKISDISSPETFLDAINTYLNPPYHLPHNSGNAPLIVSTLLANVLDLEARPSTRPNNPSVLGALAGKACDYFHLDEKGIRQQDEEAGLMPDPRFRIGQKNLRELAKACAKSIPQGGEGTVYEKKFSPLLDEALNRQNLRGALQLLVERRHLSPNSAQGFLLITGHETAETTSNPTLAAQVERDTRAAFRDKIANGVSATHDLSILKQIVGYPNDDIPPRTLKEYLAQYRKKNPGMLDGVSIKAVRIQLISELVYVLTREQERQRTTGKPPIRVR